MDYDQAVAIAIEMSMMARPHLSGFHVGACLLDVNGHMWGGFNIEFDNYSNTLHAEEVAISNWAINEGAKLKTIVIYTPTREFTYPCGMCRQSLFELEPELGILVVNHLGDRKFTTIKELMPHGFRLERK